MSTTALRPLALVVEDDEHIGRLLKFILQRGGYDVEYAADGRLAQTWIESHGPPAVVLLDVMLPHVDGLQLVTLLRGQPAWAAVPVLMLTAKAQDRDIRRALDAGATDYIAKPFHPDDLLRRVREHAPPPA